MIGHTQAHPYPVNRTLELVTRWEAESVPTQAPRVPSLLELGARLPLRPLKVSPPGLPNPLPMRQGLVVRFGLPVRCLPEGMLSATQSGQLGLLVRERRKILNR